MSSEADRIKYLTEEIQKGVSAGFELQREKAELRALLRDLRTYTAELEAASAAWFLTHRSSKRPEAGDLPERLDAVLGS